MDVGIFQSCPGESDMKSRLKIKIENPSYRPHLPPTPLVDDSILTHKFFSQKKTSKDPGGRKDRLHGKGRFWLVLKDQRLSSQGLYSSRVKRLGAYRPFARGNAAPTYGRGANEVFHSLIKTCSGSNRRRTYIVRIK